MLKFFKRRLHHLLVALGLKKPHPPLTPATIAEAALIMLDYSLFSAILNGGVTVRAPTSSAEITPRGTHINAMGGITFADDSPTN